MSPVPVVLSIAGSDSGGGAGIQADIKAIQACGGFAVTVVTAVTAQNTTGVTAVHPVPVETVEAQMRAVLDDLPVAAAKTGMLADPGVVSRVARMLHGGPPLVVDPVISSKTGHRLVPEEAVTAIREKLLPRASVATPNRHEAQILAGRPVEDPAGMREAARMLQDTGCAAVIITGGAMGGAVSMDLLLDDQGFLELEEPRIDSRCVHGTGCTFSAALAAMLAQGRPLREAAAAAKRYVTDTVRHGLDIGAGKAPGDHFHFLRRGGPAP